MSGTDAGGAGREMWTAERLAEVLPAEVVAMVPGLALKPRGTEGADGTFWTKAHWHGQWGWLTPDEAAALVTAALLRALASTGRGYPMPVPPCAHNDLWTVGMLGPSSDGDLMRLVKYSVHRAPTLLEALLAAYAATGHPARDGGAGE